MSSLRFSAPKSTGAPLDFLHNVRVTHWSYPADIIREHAEDKVRQLVETGINMILTESHRYILYDLQDPDNPPHFHFACQNKAASVRATKLITDVCHSHGVKVLHHVTSSYCSEDFMNQHREWTQRDVRYPEKPVYFEMYGGVWLLCLNNPEFRKTFFKTVVDIVKQTGVDGLMIDEVEWLPTWFSCGCEHCREKFHRETGYILPEGEHSPVWENFEDPVWRAWIRFRMKSTGDFFVDLRRLLDEEVPNQILTACHAGAGATWLTQQWGADIIEYSRGTNFIFYEAYINKGIPFYNWLPHLAEMKLYSAVARRTGYPVLSLFYGSSDTENSFCWRMCGLSGHRQWLSRGPEHPAVNKKAENLSTATTYSPWALYGSEGYRPDFFPWERDNQDLFGNVKQIANIALLFSKQTRDVYKGCNDEFYVQEWTGWAETLIEANTPYAVIIDEDLTSDYLKEFHLLILPNAACLSEAQLSAIDDFIEEGGSVISTSETGMRDETGAERSDTSGALALLNKSRYFPEKIGQQCFLDYVRREKPFEDNRSDAARARLVEAVRGMMGDNIPWSTDAPRGVVVNMLMQESRNVVIHLLNCTGASVQAGLTIPDINYSLTFPPVDNITIDLRKEMLGRLTGASLHTLEDTAPVRLSLKESTDHYSLQIPRLNEGGVIKLKNLS